ncbi:hypothetical protein CJ030_MR3G022808 [Morella rubra]|uniref:Myb/SANT-like domain-containing protein n=1 Tax=Morella rubra TaxID=262757 RepID=A0A6A1W8D6_9ROSI|nr:hypothetical protein CJ030_MR3G022808 [Morella rubra]
MDSAGMRRRLSDSSVTGEQPLPLINERPLHGERRRTRNRSSRSLYPKRWRSFSASRATAPHKRQSWQELRGLAVDKDLSFCRYCNKGLSAGRFLRSGKRMADQPIYASSIRMRPSVFCYFSTELQYLLDSTSHDNNGLLRDRLWSNPSEVQDLVYLLLDEWRDGKFIDGKPENGKVWDRITANLSIPNISVSQVVNKVQSLKADYKAFCTLKKQTGVGWNYETNTVEADDVWWDNFTRSCDRAKKFKKQGLANFPELDLLFAESTAAGLNAYSSGQGGETEEEAARVEGQNRYRHGPVGRVTEEHIASGGLRTDSNGPAPMNTQSGARKRGSTSIGRRGKEKVQHSSEDLFFDKANTLIDGMTQCHGASSHFNPTFQACIEALEKIDPPLTAEQSTRLVGQVGRKSDSSSGHGDQKKDPIVVEDIAGDDEVTHEPTPQLGRVSWGTPQMLWAQFGSGFIANQNKSDASSFRVVVLTIEQAIKRIEGRMKRPNDDKHT